MLGKQIDNYPKHKAYCGYAFYKLAFQLYTKLKRWGLSKYALIYQSLILTFKSSRKIPMTDCEGQNTNSVGYL